jgi:hypothetical protein
VAPLTVTVDVLKEQLAPDAPVGVMLHESLTPPV